MKNPFKSGRLYSILFILLTLGGLISLAAVPGISLSGLSTGFRGRERMIGWYNSLRLRLGDQDFGNTVVGKEGWIFWMDPGITNDYQRVDLLPDDQLRALGSGLDRLTEDLQSRGITLLVVVPPDKSTIYPQYMPAQIPILSPVSRLDQFMEFMNKEGHTRVIDLRSMLLDASRKEQVYFTTDSHWNDRGAFLAYEEIMKPLEAIDPRLAPHPISDYQVSDEGMLVRDLPRIMELNGLREETYSLVPDFLESPPEPGRRRLPDKLGIRRITRTDTSLPTLLIFRDSFYNHLAQFIEPHFSKTIAIPFVLKPEIWSLKWIDKESPDVVIIEIVERNLVHLIPLLYGFNQ